MLYLPISFLNQVTTKLTILSFMLSEEKSLEYLRHLGIVEKINSLRVEKQSGIPVEKAVLALLQLSIVGMKRISRVEYVTDQGLAVFAGLSKMPDPSFFHDFLDSVKTSDAEQFNIILLQEIQRNGAF